MASNTHGGGGAAGIAAPLRLGGAPIISPRSSTNSIYEAAMTCPVHSFDAQAGTGQFRPLSLNVDASDLVRYVEARDPVAIARWDDLGRDEYGRAFTAAGTAGLDIIDDIYFAYVDNLNRRGTEADFAKLIVPTLKAKGWLNGDDGQIARRVALIYDTNLRVARGAGQWDRIQKGKAALPYLRAITARDTRVRKPPKSPLSDHRAWDGIILPVDHPFWTRWWVPLGFRCRCSIVPMTRSQLAKYRTGVTDDADLAEREARLGRPVFAAPGGGVMQQLAEIARVENDRPDRMPGLPMLDVAAERAEGQQLWSLETAALAVTTLFDRIFR
jgi:hypothetical protein